MDYRLPDDLGFLGVIYAVMIVMAFFKMRRQMAALSISLTDDTISMAVPGLLAAALAQWRPIEPAVPSRGAWKRTLIVFGVIAGWAATYLLMPILTIAVRVIEVARR